MSRKVVVPFSQLNSENSQIKVLAITDSYAYENGVRAASPNGKAVEIVILSGNYDKYRVKVPMADGINVGDMVSLVEAEATIYPKSQFELGISVTAKGFRVLGVNSNSSVQTKPAQRQPE